LRTFLENFEQLKKGLVTHLVDHALRTDGPFQLSSGGWSDWYLDGRQTTYDGDGGRLVGSCVASILSDRVTAVGGLTMGADPVAIATAIVSPGLKSFSIRKEEKAHGVGGRVVGPVTHADVAAIVDDTTTTGASLVESAKVLASEGIDVAQAIVVVDRSGGAARRAMRDLGIPFHAVVVPGDLGVA
jgi:orotate phosphoribosyltransferase